MPIHLIHRNRILLVLTLLFTPSLAQAEWGGDLWGPMVWGPSVAVPMLPGSGLVLVVFLAGSASWALLRKQRRAAWVLGALALAVPLLTQAKEISFPHSFANGTVADADEVNANFHAVSTFFDDFSSRFGRSPTDPLGAQPNSAGVCTNRTIGEAWLFVGNFEPEGTVFAHGQILSIVTYDSLYSIVGINYGGDGLTTFGVPDMRGLEPEGLNYVICVYGLFPPQN
jgi:hypothetical protein